MREEEQSDFLPLFPMFKLMGNKTIYELLLVDSNLRSIEKKLSVFSCAYLGILFWVTQTIYLPNFCRILLVNIFNSGNLSCMAIKPKIAIAIALETLNSISSNNKLSLPIVFSKPWLTP